MNSVVFFYWFVEVFRILHLSFFSFFRDNSASWRDSRLRGPWFFDYLSDCEAGVTLVVFPCGSFSEAWDFYDFWIFTCLGAGMAD